MKADMLALDTKIDKAQAPLEAKIAQVEAKTSRLDHDDLGSNQSTIMRRDRFQ
jgi:hypothetical protein